MGVVGDWDWDGDGDEAGGSSTSAGDQERFESRRHSVGRCQSGGLVDVSPYSSGGHQDGDVSGGSSERAFLVVYILSVCYRS